MTNFRIILFAAVLLPAGSLPTQANTERSPEPVPSAAAQMFGQLESGDWRNWIEKAEALDYLSRYEVPDAAPAVQKVLDDMDPNNRWLRGRAVIAMARIDPALYETILARPGVRPMDFTGRPMKGFIFVDPIAIDREEDLAYFIDLALQWNPHAKASKKKSS